MQAKSRWFGGALLAATVGVLPASAHAESARPDTALVPLPGIEVTALRGRDSLTSIPAAAFVISRDQIAAAASPRLSAALQSVPGLFAYGQTSSSDPTVVDPRGFSANGERSYLRLLVDGRDVRDVETGNVDWDWVAPGEIERVEVVQGPGAWVYGDASEGGIVNVVRTPLGDRLATSATARGGSFGLGAGSLTLSGPVGSLLAGATGSVRHVDGWRDNSRERVYGGDARTVASWGERRFTLEASGLDADREDPGYLDAATFAADPSAAATSTDFLHAKHGRLDARLQSSAGAEPRWALAGYGRIDDANQVKTLFFQPLVHATDAGTAGGSAEWRGRGAIGGRPLTFTSTAEFERTGLRSDYRDPADAALLSRGQSTRTSGALSAGTLVELGRATLLRVSVRGDLARVDTRDELTGADPASRTMSAVSPLVGLNHRLGESTNAYASASTAFRVPSLYQLYDLRPIYDPFSNSFVSISNTELDPQRASSVEAGMRWGHGGASAQFDAYSTWVRDEVDFDLGTLRYENLSRTWHRGLEALVVLPLPARLALRASGAYTPTTFANGDNEGHQINSVPLGTGTASLEWSPAHALSARVGARLIGRQYLDKAERDPLGSVVAWDAGLDAPVGRVHASIQVTNLFDRTYAESGYLDPLIGAALLPAAPRAVSVAVTLR